MFSALENVWSWNIFSTKEWYIYVIVIIMHAGCSDLLIILFTVMGQAVFMWKRNQWHVWSL